MGRKNKAPKWFVSRQNYWGEENPLCVEIASGGLDYANPDMLVAKYRSLGEGSEYTDPHEAAKDAVKIAEQWRKDTGKSKDEITVRHGCTGGATMPFDEGTDEEAIEWGKQAYDALPKCPQCGEVMGDDKYRPHWADDDSACCSENCAEKHFAQDEENEEVTSS